MSGRIRANEKVHYIASTTFTLDRIYSDLKMIGKGSYGVVCSALDLTTGSKVAIKKITPMAKDILDAKHVLREIRLMRHMGKHENVISLNDLMVRESADELYIVMELLDSDLHRVLQSPQILTQSHFRFFLHQLLCGVKYLHDNRIIHRSVPLYNSSHFLPEIWSLGIFWSLVIVN
jgi:serine/threonine protein kinase